MIWGLGWYWECWLLWSVLIWEIILWLFWWLLGSLLFYWCWVRCENLLGCVYWLRVCVVCWWLIIRWWWLRNCVVCWCDWLVGLKLFVWLCRWVERLRWCCCIVVYWDWIFWWLLVLLLRVFDDWCSWLLLLERWERWFFSVDCWLV